MNKAFTLIELLVVVAIMGLLGTTTVGGYRQMQRGMEERRVVDNASRFLEIAYERAQIDRQPTVVYYWNEMIRAAEDEDESDVIVGRAVAVKAHGRITKSTSDFLIDEYGDLERFDANGNYSEETVDDGKSQSIRLYCLDNLTEQKYSLVTAPELAERVTETYATCNPQNYGTCGLDQKNSNDLYKNEGSSGLLYLFGYKIENKNNVTWRVGSKYGMEFQTIELPRGYLFDNDVPTSISAPVTKSKVKTFKPDSTGGSLPIYALRQQKNGAIQATFINNAQVSTGQTN